MKKRHQSERIACRKREEAKACAAGVAADPGEWFEKEMFMHLDQVEQEVFDAQASLRGIRRAIQEIRGVVMRQRRVT